MVQLFVRIQAPNQDCLMTETARWEWRMFGRSLANVGPMPDSGSSTPAATREQYVLSVASVHNVKIRDNCLDIKTLVRRDELGLEQWEPTLKVPFPIDQASLDAAWTAWGFPGHVARRTRYALKEFLTEVIPSEHGLRTVEIEKRRTPMVVLGCPGERATVTIGNQAWESISFEHVEPYRVWRAVRGLGLENAENTNYPRALKRIVGFQFAEQPEKMETK